MHTCQYCDSTFTTRGSLTKHQKTAQYCLVLQQGKKPQCEYCEKKLSCRSRLATHYKSCVEYQIFLRRQNEVDKKLLADKDIQLQKLEVHIKYLERQIQELAMLAINHPAPVQNRNNIVLNNLEPLTDEKLETLAIDHLTIDDLKRGVEGLIEIFSSNYPVRGSVVCTDKSRKKLCFREEDGTVIDDPGGAKLSQKFFSAIKPRYSELINQEYANITERVQDIVKRNRAVEENVVELMQEATALQNFKSECDIAAEGGANELRNDFVTRLVQTLN